MKPDDEESKDKSNELDEFGERRYNIFIDEIVRLSMDRHCFSERDMFCQAATMMVGVSILELSYISMTD